MRFIIYSFHELDALQQKHDDTKTQNLSSQEVKTIKSNLIRIALAVSALFMLFPMFTGIQAQPVSQVRSETPSRAALISELVAEHGDRMVRSRYMAQDCEPVDWPGWEGFPTEKCRYTVTDRAVGTTKSAEVVMLNPSPEKVAQWIVTACEDAGSTQPREDAHRLFRHIIGQSGGQFPVAGVVYEDMEGDGFMKAYCFRNGVTTRILGIDHRTTAPLTQQEIEASLRGPIERVYTYARIASTTPDQYKAAGGTANVGTNANRTTVWPQEIARLYQEAWNSNRNELISMWAKANLR